jgi:hypothetical protein
MIYIVSGYRRSGTSCMMKALYAGLTEGQILYQPGQERIGAQEENGYLPNPSGLHEVGQAYYMRPRFLRQIPDGSLLKVLYDGLPHLPKRDYVVVFMHRDPDEIQASCDRVDLHLRQVGVNENGKAWYPFDSFRPYSQEDIDHVVDICEVRADIKLIHVDFRWLVENPLESFRRLSTAIPIDPEKSAEIIKPDFYRFRSEDVSSKSRDEGARPYDENSELQSHGTAVKEDTSPVHRRTA